MPAIASVAQVLSDPNEIFAGAHEVICSDLARQFHAGGIPSWKPLSEITVAEKRRSGYPRRTREGEENLDLIQNGNFAPSNVLMRTGGLYSSWTDPDDPDHIFDADAAGMDVGSSLEYAATHQYGRPGGGWRGSDIPARPLVITDEALAAAATAIEATLNTAAEAGS